MAEAAIVIISGDSDFAHPLADQVTSELALTCVIAASRQEAAPHLVSAMVVVTDGPDEGDYGCPALCVKGAPVRMQALLEEIAAMHQKNSASDMTLGKGYVLQFLQKQLAHMPSGRSVTLTDKEIQLLQSVSEAKGKAVPRELLLKTVWGIDSGLDTHTLETHIYRLRGKFRELADDDSIIAAEGGGYALVMK